MKRLTTIIFMLCLTLYGFGQVDSTYIGKFNEKFSAKAFFGQRYTSLSVTESNTTNEYMPNTPIYLGVGFSWKGMGASVSYGFDFMRDQGKGKSKVLDLQTHFYGKRIGFDLYAQDYTGFYNTKADSIFIPSMRLTQIGGCFVYLFNHKHFSYRAAFTYTERQLRSSGSLQVGVNLYYAHINVDNTPLSDKVIQKNKFLTGPIVGYVYTFVIKDRLNITPSIAGGLNLGVDNVTQQFNVYPTLASRLSVGYSLDTWTFNLTGIYNLTYVVFDTDRNSRLNSVNLRVSFIKRFDL